MINFPCVQPPAAPKIDSLHTQLHRDLQTCSMQCDKVTAAATATEIKQLDDVCGAQEVYTLNRIFIAAINKIK